MSDGAMMVQTGSTLNDQFRNDGSIPISSLHFQGGQKAEAELLVKSFHYSRRKPSNVQFIGSLHLEGGLFGDQGKMIAAAFFSIPPTRWTEPVLELSRLVRIPDVRVPLTFLIAKCMKELKQQGYDLVVSFADKTHGHVGYVYRAANWNYFGFRESRVDGLTIDGSFLPGRSCNAKWGTRSANKLIKMLPHKRINPHFDMGKHLYWKALGKRGEKKAERLGLK